MKLTKEQQRMIDRVVPAPKHRPPLIIKSYGGDDDLDKYYGYCMDECSGSNKYLSPIFSVTTGEKSVVISVELGFLSDEETKAYILNLQDKFSELKSTMEYSL